MAQQALANSRESHGALGSLVAVLRLIRIEYCLLGAAAVLAPWLMTGSSVPGGAVLLSSAAVFLVAAGCYAFGDYFDRDCDAANGRWDRPLVSGSPTPRVAFAVGALAFLLSAIAALLAGASTAIIVALGAVLAMVYNRWLQGLFPLKNILLAGAFPAPLVIGGLAAGTPESLLLYCAGLAYVIGLGFEVMIDIADIAGDRTSGVVTVATRYDAGVASHVAAALYAAGAVLILLPFFLTVDARLQWDPVFLGIAGIAALSSLLIGRSLVMDHSPGKVLALKNRAFVTLHISVLAFVAGALL
ncbi:MAG: UbiA family prenyltransferase [Chloroflexi bacterium]|nr:UbiA family prenyltransferase [Chloroflexota bacterium]